MQTSSPIPTQLQIKKDADAAKILNRYAAWHPEVEIKELCAPCNHCISGEHCTPCGSCQPRATED